MKYSLRNLMTFSVRDLFWLTVAVALLVAWWVERRKNIVLRQENDVMQVGFDLMTRNWVRIVDELNTKRRQLGEPVAEAGEENPSEKIRIRQLGTPLPNSQAPAPNPPKP